MGNDLVKLYRELQSMGDSQDLEVVREKIVNELNQKMRHSFLELLEIGGVLGYDHLETEMKKAVELIGSMKG